MHGSMVGSFLERLPFPSSHNFPYGHFLVIDFAFPLSSRFYVSLRKFSREFSIPLPSTIVSCRGTFGTTWKEQKLPTVGEKKDSLKKSWEKERGTTRLEGILHWWNLIHLIDSKWSNSDLAGHDRSLSVGIKTFCPVEKGDNDFAHCLSLTRRFKWSH